jgi:hypothetical protein
MEQDLTPSWETREVTHEVELLALIEELDSAIAPGYGRVEPSRIEAR